MTHAEIQEIARTNNLGKVWFEDRFAQNTGRYFEAGFVSLPDGTRSLFCKRGSNSNPDQFRLCNDYAKLKPD